MSHSTRTIIEITDDQIKLTQTAVRDANVVVKHYIVAGIESPKESAIAAQLVALNKSHNLNLLSSELVLVVSRQHVILRYLNLPSQDPVELRQMVGLQAINHIPYEPEEVVIDFMKLISDHEGYSKVLAVIVRKDIVMRLAKIVEMAKFRLGRITVSSVGIYYWYKGHGIKKDGATILLDLYEKESEICICTGEYLFTSRHVPTGINGVNESKYEDFIKQIDLTIGSYNKEKLGPLVKNIAVLASFESLAEFTEQLTKEYNIPVEYIRTLKSQSEPGGQFRWPKDILLRGTSLAIGLGLGLEKDCQDIDLTPPEIRQAEFQKKMRVSMIRVCAIALLAVIAFGFALNLETMNQRLYLTNLESQLKDVKSKVSQAEKKAEQVNALKLALASRMVFLDVIDELYRILPKGTSLVSLNVSSGRRLSLQGVTQQGGDVNVLQSAMVNSKLFRTVNLDYVNKRVTQEGEINYFKITCEIGKSNL